MILGAIHFCLNDTQAADLERALALDPKTTSTIIDGTLIIPIRKRTELLSVIPSTPQYYEQTIWSLRSTITNITTKTIAVEPNRTSWLSTCQYHILKSAKQNSTIFSGHIKQNTCQRS